VAHCALLFEGHTGYFDGVRNKAGDIMKCFTGSVPGIKTIPDQFLGQVVSLGEAGRGRELTKVKLDSRNPPIVLDGNIHEAGIMEFEAGGRKRHALIAGKSGDTRALVVTCAGTCYTRGTSGSSSAYWGNPVRVTGGYGAFGDAGRLGTWDHSLWILAADDAVVVLPSGGHKVTPYVLWHNGEKIEKLGVEDFRTQIIGRWLETASPEMLASAIEIATARRSAKLVAFLEAGSPASTSVEI